MWPASYVSRTGLTPVVTPPPFRPAPTLQADPIQVRIKSVYGNETIYPACETAKAFARLLGQTTLTFVDVQGIKAIGFAVSVIQDKVTL